MSLPSPSPGNGTEPVAEPLEVHQAMRGPQAAPTNEESTNDV
jgi:hypothetical protein